MSIKECMDLTSDQLDWLVEHYGYPMKLRGDLAALPEISPQLAQLESAGLVEVEKFPVTGIASCTPEGVTLKHKYTILVVTLTKKGYTLVAQTAPITILQKWGDIISEAFLEKHLFPYITLAALPELLVGDNIRWRDLAIKEVTRLKREVTTEVIQGVATTS